MSEGKAYPLVFTRAAARSFRRMPKNTADLIQAKLRQLADDPTDLADNVKLLRGGDRRYRLRIGDWRAIFMIEPDRIIIHDIGPRGSIYE